MNILFVGYWGANEGLSQATINPHLEILASFPEVEKIIYSSIERGEEKMYRIPQNQKLKHLPLKANRWRFRIINKIYEVLFFSRQLKNVARKEAINLIICRSTLAGNFGLFIHQKLKIPFVVESFEPHAEYMREIGIWKRTGISYHFQKKKEKLQITEAGHLFPVSNKYKEFLVEQGVDPLKISVIPCCVDLDVFDFSVKDRLKLRKYLSIGENAKTGIYVGKFGGIYFTLNDAFKLFKAAADYFEQFHLILLTPTSEEEVEEVAKQVNFSVKNLTVKSVLHTEVPPYLSASDFAYSLHLPKKNMRYVSPIKNGEYWANGLPVLISEEIGDDSEILKDQGLGSIMTNRNNLRKCYSEIQSIWNIPDYRNKIKKLAKDFKSFDLVKNAYQKSI